MSTIQFPDTISIYENMGIEAARHKSGMGGAFRILALGKAIDMQGLGRVRRDDLREFVLSLGVSRRSWERWLNDARSADFVSDVQKQDGTWWLILKSAGKVAAILGCGIVGRKVTMPAEVLIRKGWRAKVFAAWQHEKRISQRTIEKDINVPVRTQVYRNRQAEIKCQKNVAKSDIRGRGMNVHDLREFLDRRTAFVTSDGHVAWRLPDYREAANVTTGRQGRSRKANQEIKDAKREGLLSVQQALTSDEHSKPMVRIFCETKRQWAIAEQKISEGTHGAKDVYIYTNRTTRKGTIVWVHRSAQKET